MSLKTMTQEDRLVKSRIKLLVEYPFFGQLALYLKLQENNSLPTAATDGKKYYYNSEFVSGLTDEELNFLTAHETLHPALGHIWRGQGKNQKVFNMAADYVINGMIKEVDPQEKTFKMIKGGLYDKRFIGMSTEEIYEILIQEGEDGEGQGKQPIDDHDIWGQDSGEGEDGSDGNQEDWQGRLVQASQVAEGKNQGSVPALIKRMLKNLTSPQKNWKQLLAEFVQHEINDYGFSPPDRRFSHADIILPDFSEPEDVVKNLVFAVDTSGSIGEKEFTVFLSEIMGCMSQFGGRVKGHLIYCDYEIYKNGVYDLEDAHKSLPVGGGGTDFRPVFNWIEDNLDECAGLVYLTDGYGGYPQREPNYPTLWVLTNEYNVPFGMTTRIEV